MLVVSSAIVAVGNTVPWAGLTWLVGHNWTIHFSCPGLLWAVYDVLFANDAVRWLWMMVMATVLVLLAAWRMCLTTALAS